MPLRAVARRGEARVGVDGAGLDVVGLGHALDELVQFKRLEEGDQALGVDAVERQLLGRHLEGRIAFEGDEPLRQERLVGVVEHLAGGGADHARKVSGPHERPAEGEVAAEPLQRLGIGGRLALLVERQIGDAEFAGQDRGDLGAGTDLDRLAGERVELCLKFRQARREHSIEFRWPILIGEDRLERAELADQRRGRLRADARHPRHVVGRIADERLDVRHLLGRRAELLDHAGAVEPALGAVARLALQPQFRVVEGDAVADELHQVLVGRDDQHVGAGFRCPAGIGGDEVVRLEAGLLDRDQPERPHSLARQRKLRHELGRGIAAVRLVAGEELVAERVLRLVENDGEMGRLHADGALAEELQDLRAEQAHGAGRQPVRRAHIVFPVLVHGLEIGAEDEGRPVDEENLVAGTKRTRWVGHAGTD